MSLEVYRRELVHMKPVNQVKPFDVTFHIRKAYKREIIDMIEVGIIVPCEVPTNWNTKAFSGIKGDRVSIRLVGDFRGLNSVLKKLLWDTESCDKLLRHIPSDSRVFVSQLRVDDQASKLLTIVTNMGRFSYRCLL